MQNKPNTDIFRDFQRFRTPFQQIDLARMPITTSDLELPFSNSISDKASTTTHAQYSLILCIKRKTNTLFTVFKWCIRYLKYYDQGSECSLSTQQCSSLNKLRHRLYQIESVESTSKCKLGKKRLVVGTARSLTATFCSSLHSQLYTRYKAQKTTQRQIVIASVRWAKMDSNHRRRKPADLQSAPFGHSGICPFCVCDGKGRHKSRKLQENP